MYFEVNDQNYEIFVDFKLKHFINSINIITPKFNLDYLDELTNLMILKINGIGLTEIPKNLPKRLNFIDLRFNQITRFEHQLIPDQVETIFLDYNKINTIDHGYLPKSIRSISIQSNKLECVDLSIFTTRNFIFNCRLNNITMIDFGQFKEHDLKCTLPMSLFLEENLIIWILYDNKIYNPESFNNMVGPYNSRLYIREQRNPDLSLSDDLYQNDLYQNDLYQNDVDEDDVDEDDDDFYQDDDDFYQDDKNRLIGFQDDPQNIHESEIQKSFIESVKKITIESMKVEKETSFLFDPILTIRAKNEIVKRCYINDSYNRNDFIINYYELFTIIWKISFNNDDLKKRIDEEVTESIGKCLIGSMTRLVNALIGFFDFVEIKISNKTRLNSICSMIIGMDDVTDDKIMKIAERTEYSFDEIKEYLSSIFD